MVEEILTTAFTSLSHPIDSTAPVDASGAVLPEVSCAITEKLRSEGWEVDTRSGITFEPPDKIRVMARLPGAKAER